MGASKLVLGDRDPHSWCAGGFQACVFFSFVSSDGLDPPRLNFAHPVSDAISVQYRLRQMIHFLSAFYFSLIVLLLFLLVPYSLNHESAISFPVLPIFFCGIFLGIFDFGQILNILSGGGRPYWLFRSVGKPRKLNSKVRAFEHPNAPIHKKGTWVVCLCVLSGM